MARISKKRFNKRLYLIAIVITALLAALITGGVLLNSGLRYTTYPTSEHGDIKFVGKVDKNGIPIKGTVYYADGLTAKVSSAESGSAMSTIESDDDDSLTVYTLKLTYSNGDVYEGETVHFLRHGKGKLTFSGGDVYEGDFVFDDMEGSGIYRYLGGDVYEGEFADNQKNGEGSYKWAADDEGKFDSYTGGYLNNMRSGEGIYTYADGSVFEGVYVDDAKNGKGSLQFANGDQYEGDFVNDYRTGEGSYTWASGDTYVGDFYRNAITGYGTYTWSEGGDRKDYTGYFENGKIVLVDESEEGEQESEDGESD